MRIVDTLNQDIKTSVRSFGRAFRPSTPTAPIVDAHWDEGYNITEVEGGNREKTPIAPIVRFAVAVAELFTEKHGLNPVRAVGILPAVSHSVGNFKNASSSIRFYRVTPE
ncbi:hypothetical protein HY310_02215 [Candidatus Microgenomates bacterium]|nr:hypothetical protein [Candidatus Microgenomates bacterium]